VDRHNWDTTTGGASMEGLLRSIEELLKAILALLAATKVTPPVDPPIDPPPPPIDPPPVDDPPVEDPPPPPADDKCPKPIGIKLGFRQDVRKLASGYRNMADITPLIPGGVADPGCGLTYFREFGEPQAFQSLEGKWQFEPVERASGDSYGCILVFATNDERRWTTGKYDEAGKMTIGVSYPWLSYWRCQDVTMGEDGRIYGGGMNAQSYDRPK
jgi:hypothetical protein